MRIDVINQTLVALANLNNNVFTAQLRHIKSRLRGIRLAARSEFAVGPHAGRFWQLELRSSSSFEPLMCGRRRRRLGVF